MRYCTIRLNAVHGCCDMGCCGTVAGAPAATTLAAGAPGTPELQHASSGWHACATEADDLEPSALEHFNAVTEEQARLTSSCVLMDDPSERCTAMDDGVTSRASVVQIREMDHVISSYISALDRYP